MLVLRHSQIRPWNLHAEVAALWFGRLWGRNWRLSDRKRMLDLPRSHQFPPGGNHPMQWASGPRATHRGYPFGHTGDVPADGHLHPDPDYEDEVGSPFPFELCRDVCSCARRTCAVVLLGWGATEGDHDWEISKDQVWSHSALRVIRIFSVMMHHNYPTARSHQPIGFLPKIYNF